VYGVDAARTRIRYENGLEIWRRVEDSWIALEPQPQVMGYGTKIEVKSIDTPQGVLEYWRAAPMYATSYSPCRIFQGRCDSVTASGATLQHGVAAVSLSHYGSMAGSRVYVPGYGIATILDAGGGIPGRSWIDLGYSDENYVSWHEWVTVYFLTPVPPEELILFDLN
jgi:3D (Asp-Asp-Asp) domain-containing protein